MSAGRGAAYAVLLVLGAAACSGESDANSVHGHTSGGPDAATGCGPLETTGESGGCAPVGVDPMACGPGFASDDAGGCRAVLPDTPCPAGQVALLGETSCHDISPCGTPPWGDIPIEASTEFVDRSYTGGASDGTKAKPWTTIKSAIDAAQSGAIVAVAAGVYGESVSFYGKKVRLWGVCPSKVEIHGSSATPGALDLGYALKGSEVHGVAVTSPTRGVLVSGALGSVFEHVWVHDTANLGFVAVHELGDTEVTIRSSLVESTHAIGIVGQGVTITIEDTVVRDTKSLMGAARGIEIDNYPNGPPSTGAIRRSITEGIPDVSMYISASTATIESSLVRNGSGPGIEIYDDPLTKVRADLTVTATVVENVAEAGLWNVGSNFTATSCTVRTVNGKPDGTMGRGVYFQRNPDSGVQASGTVTRSLVDDSHEIGVCLFGSTATVDGVLVENTVPSGMGSFGDGVTILADHSGGSMIIVGSRIEHSARAGVAAIGANVTLGRTTFECNMVDLNGQPYYVDGLDAAFDNQGDNVCGCVGKTIPCEVKSALLEAPQAPQ